MISVTAFNIIPTNAERNSKDAAFKATRSAARIAKARESRVIKAITQKAKDATKANLKAANIARLTEAVRVAKANEAMAKAAAKTRPAPVSAVKAPRRTTVKGRNESVKSRRVSVNIQERVKHTWSDVPVYIKPVIVKAPKPVIVKVTKRKRKYTAGDNAGAIRGNKYGLQAQHFGNNGIRGNYFSDYVMDKISRNATYERNVNGRDRIDAFAVVNGVAHIVEFKTGGLNDRVYMEQVLRYAKGIRNEGYSNIKITMLYSDNRSHNKSWKVNMATLDADHARVSPKKRA